MSKVEIFEGILEPFYETGTEGILWSIQEHKHIHSTGGYENGPRWDYEGLKTLENGDQLIVYKKDGSVEIEYKINLDTSIMTYNGYYVYGMPKSIDHTLWWKLFEERRNCKVIRGKLI